MAQLGQHAADRDRRDDAYHDEAHELPWTSSTEAIDPWGHPYVYKSPGEHRSDYDLSSKGKDEASEKDDIVNWQ